MTIKKTTFYLITLAMTALISTPALASEMSSSVIPVSTGILLALAIIVVLAYKVISAKLKKVNKYIEESIGEKI